jgi:hypothetical protein
VSISKDGTLAQAVAPAHAAGVVDVDVANPDGTSATASSAFTFGTAQIGCGTDCGNVGDPYEGKGRPPSQQPISACATITAAGNFIVTQNIGTDPTAMCLHVYYPPGPVNIDLGGRTVTGTVGLGTNQSPNIIFHGTIFCNVAYGSTNGGACLNWGTRGRIHHITVENTNANPLSNIDTGGTVSSSTTSPVLRIDHVTSTVVAAPHSNRTRNFRDDGSSGSNPAITSLPEEVDHNLITCSDNASACQGVEMYDAPHSYVHNNMIVLPVVCSLCTDSARGILFDHHSDNGEAAYNEIVTRSNRAVRVRQSHHISIHDNLFENITIGGRLAAVHVGESNVGIDNDFVDVFNNTFGLGPRGNGVVSSAASQVDVYDNTINCMNNDCSGIGFFALTDVPDTVPADQTGTTMLVKNNDISSLTKAGKDTVKVCGPPGSVAFKCVGSSSATSSATVCNSGTAVGNGKIVNVNPPCP